MKVLVICDIYGCLNAGKATALDLRNSLVEIAGVRQAQDGQKT